MITPTGELLKKLTKSELKQINEMISSGVVNRARILSIIFSISYGIYGLSSTDFIRMFDSNVTLWANTWPRLLVNSIPFTFIAIFFKDIKKNPVLKSWIWTFGFPLIFVAACCVHVWPIIYSGRPEIYLYVHAANAIVISLSSLLVSQPPKQVLGMHLWLLCIFHCPILWMFHRAQNQSLLNMYMSEMILFTTMSLIGSHHIYRLRLRLAVLDVLNRGRISKFVGKTVTSAIFENKEELLNERQTEGFILSVDIRGSTELSKAYGEEQIRNFMKDYQNSLSNTVGKYGGFVHKFNGDGHIISFGVMDEFPDLSDIPGLEQEERTASQNRNRYFLGQAVKALEQIIHQFYRIKSKYQITTNTRIGASIDFGAVGIVLQGDNQFRSELDLTGIVIVRGTRLEAYTKTLYEVANLHHSIMILSPTAALYLPEGTSFKHYDLNDHPVRDFPEIKFILYKEIGSDESVSLAA
jgi:class 3 adenylate cyclase